MRQSLIRMMIVLAALLAAPAAARPPLVLAAASLQEALTAAAAAYAATGHTRPVISFAASSALARQIDAGAPADLFISADTEWIDYLAGGQRLQPASIAVLASNRLVLIAPAVRPFKLAIAPSFALKAALGSGKLALANPDGVPAGRYARAALTSLGVWAAVEPQVVRADNVRGALQLVARDAAVAGVVYATDARASRDVVVVGTFPESSHKRIVYPLALVAGSANTDAVAFRSFLLAPAGRAIMARYGFGPP